MTNNWRYWETKKKDREIRRKQYLSDTKEELIDKCESLEGDGYYLSSQKKKKQMRAEAMSQSLKKFGA